MNLFSTSNDPTPAPPEKTGVSATAIIMFIIAACFLAMAFLCSCQHPQKRTAAPQASTAAVGVNLDALGQSLGKAQNSVSEVRSNLSEVDSKAVKIHQLIHGK
ncbi:MAG: hypothetical protein WCK57_00625 [Verrucomicrobiae bacterium]